MGSSGSGKTTLAEIMSKRLKITHYELDQYFWGPKWTKARDHEFLESISKICSLDQWIIEGLYPHVKEPIMNRADTLIWLDFQMHITLFRIVSRTITNVVKGKELWNGNRENLAHLFGDFLPFIIRSHKNNREFVEELFKEARENITYICIKSTSEFNSFVNSLTKNSNI